MPYVRHICVLLPLIRPHVGNLYVLLPLVVPHLRHAHLSLYMGVGLKGRTICICSFSFSFACATTMGCAGFKLSFGIIILL